MTTAEKPLKVVVWDLDNTFWQGILLEDGDVEPREGVAEAVRELDARGVVQSVASRNDAATALARLTELGLAEYFLVPQIGWGAKSESVRRIAEALNLGLDAFLFLDDDPFEHAEVSRAHPQVRTAEFTDAAALLTRPDLAVAPGTPDGSWRRLQYRTDLRRADAEQEFTGTPDEFLATLGLRLTVRHAQPGDLRRAEELTVRTHQLNATGYTYSMAELDELRSSASHALLVAELADRFGDYGTIGLVLVEQGAELWTLKLLLVSCRVMSRGTGTVLLNHVIGRAIEQGVRLRGEFVPTDRNRPMQVAYRFAGFAPAGEENGVMLLEHRGGTAPALPAHLDLRSAF
ncbi:HAD-IIIC family phosphatase [Kitasatospora sp. NPDC002227]|uniref:HAD-IIIC family phosphatase n=1 Tax=Kitasatospora sp. NPDC002227 TaxID=3154773 RepID=UPI00332AE6FD